MESFKDEICLPLQVDKLTFLLFWEVSFTCVCNECHYNFSIAVMALKMDSPSPIPFT